MAWGKWKKESNVLAAERQAVGGVVHRMMERKVSMAWRQWKEVAA